MTIVKQYRTVSAWLALLALLFSPCAGLLSHAKPGARPFSATPVDKISPDLRAALRTGQHGARVKVIVQFTDDARVRPHDSLLANPGVVVLKQIQKLNARVLSLSLRGAEALAESKEVRYVSLDRQIAPAGHVTTTTGADDVRQQTTSGLLGLLTTTTTLDGSNIGIAVLDSGIDSNHVSFRDSLGLSRISLSHDFTGEDRTDDVYGHGTHVASAAAGNGQVAQGAYTGIAPNAQLL
ncbi:MAG TPA: S8 family serine peptidase, partial [Pyrinomonadaceae bacterium]|nr:S8 family serine peptidase [Pyrinomonadaceae bacterium]